MHLPSKLNVFKRNSLKMWLQKVTKVSLSWFDWIFPAEISSNIEQYISGEQQHNHLPGPCWCDLLCHVSSSSGLSGGKITMLGTIFQLNDDVILHRTRQNMLTSPDFDQLEKYLEKPELKLWKKISLKGGCGWKILVFWLSFDCFNNN